MNAVSDRINGGPIAPLQIGAWCVAADLNQISRNGEVARLEPKAIAVLVFLAQRAGEVVSREELLTALWPGVIVGDNALTQVVIKLRKALGDTAREPTYIQAISKRGYRLIARVERSRPASGDPSPSPPARPATPRGSKWQRAAVASIAALLAGAVVWLVQGTADTDVLPGTALPTQASRAAGLPTVIVRPFEAIGEDTEQALIARGITADLINDLSKVTSLLVVSGIDTQGSSSPEAGKTAPGAPAPGRYVLAGTVQLDGDRLRLQVRLADFDAGRQLWSQRFDRQRRDLFAVQDDLVRSVLELLPIKVSQAETSSIAQRYTRNLAAYEYFLRGQAAIQARRHAQNERAREMYWKAIDLDPAFSRAYAGLAMTYALAYQQGWADEAALGRALEFAGTSEQMSPGMPEAHWVLGFVHTQRRQHAEAVKHLERALHLNPSFADAYALMGGIRTYTGRPAEGVSLLRAALRLNPDAGSLYFLLLGRAYYFLGDYEQARVNLEHALLRNAENVEARVYLAAVLGQLGEREAAVWQANEIRAIEPGFGVHKWLATYPMTDEAQRQRLVQAMEQLGL